MYTNFDSAMDSLHNLIKCLYRDISDNEVILAENNLLGFFKKLEEIEARILTEESSIGGSKQICDEAQHENYGS